MPDALTGLALAAAVVAGGLIPTDGTQAAYRLHGDAPAEACGAKNVSPLDVVVHLGRDESGPYALVPDAIPEQLWLSPVTRGEESDGAFGGSRADHYPIDRIGTLRLTKTLNLRAAPEGGVEGSLVVDARVDFLEDAPADLRASTGPLADGPCRSTLSLVGEPVDRPAADAEHTELIWSLLQSSMEDLLTRRVSESLEPLERGLAIAGPHRADFLWRKARSMLLVGEALPKAARDERLAIYSAGQEVAREALALDPSSAEAAFFLAAHLGRYNTTHGLVSTFFGLDEFERQALATLELGSDYDMMGFRVTGDAHNALGQFYRLVPDSLVMKVLSGARGDLDKSLEHLREAVAIQPDRGDYWKELGVTLTCIGTKRDDAAALAEGRDALETAMTQPMWAHANRELDREHAARLIEHPEDACGYSRDLY